jgi:hypothetical protein
VSWFLVAIAIRFDVLNSCVNSHSSYVSWIRQEFNKNSQQIASNSSSRIVNKSTKFLNLLPWIQVVSRMTQEACKFFPLYYLWAQHGLICVTYNDIWISQ